MKIGDMVHRKYKLDILKAGVYKVLEVNKPNNTTSIRLNFVDISHQWYDIYNFDLLTGKFWELFK